MKHLWALAVAALLAVAGASYAQDTPQVRTFVRFEDSHTTIPVETPIASDMLHVLENGRPVRAVDALAKASDLPVRYMVLFDESGSGRNSPNVHAIRSAVPDFLAKIIRPDKDKVALVDFNDEFYLDMDLTTDLDQFAAKLRSKEEYRGGTALFDAIEASTNFLARNGGGAERRVLLLFSDGEDNASRHALRQVIAAVVANHVEIYALSVAGSPGESRGTPILHQLTEATGGRMFARVQPRQSQDFFTILQRVIEAGYVLTYTRADAFGKKPVNLQVTTTLANVTAVAPRFVP